MKKEQLALLKTLQRALLEIRIIGFKGQDSGLSVEQSEFIADIADALHNIPDAITDANFDLDFHTKIMLGGFDDKYGTTTNFRLLEIYNHILQNEI
ncbi:hypothetical protein N473_08475 [Pseudoalteromonas luteoviolacea CPMOR-1]|uniref:Uncharacterized protein n=1 Tax=Pseudoalteromonas luteoviolacea CPMOR-1 TaxID=1365248 RepID=A0A167MH79_9GAMM|nr:hypothetical protein [Pseudoalteromonas luteoviolacea]KZN66415.1 hypothetical protein N473_08475 [Pseudoalteromonas luteoviolacea CPMOR-1]